MTMAVMAVMTVPSDLFNNIRFGFFGRRFCGLTDTRHDAGVRGEPTKAECDSSCCRKDVKFFISYSDSRSGIVPLTLLDYPCVSVAP